MSVSIPLPNDLETALRSRVENLDRLALEALAVELHRRGEITQFQFASVLGLTRFQADEVLKRHGVFLDLTADDVLGETRLGSEAGM